MKNHDQDINIVKLSIQENIENSQSRQVQKKGSSKIRKTLKPNQYRAQKKINDNLQQTNQQRSNPGTTEISPRTPSHIDRQQHLESVYGKDAVIVLLQQQEKLTEEQKRKIIKDSQELSEIQFMQKYKELQIEAEKKKKKLSLDEKRIKKLNELNFMKKLGFSYDFKQVKNEKDLIDDLNVIQIAKRIKQNLQQMDPIKVQEVPIIEVPKSANQEQQTQSTINNLAQINKLLEQLKPPPSFQESQNEEAIKQQIEKNKNVFSRLFERLGKKKQTVNISSPQSNKIKNQGFENPSVQSEDDSVSQTFLKSKLQKEKKKLRQSVQLQSLKEDTKDVVQKQIKEEFNIVRNSTKFSKISNRNAALKSKFEQKNKNHQKNNDLQEICKSYNFEQLNTVKWRLTVDDSINTNDEALQKSTVRSQNLSEKSLSKEQQQEKVKSNQSLKVNQLEMEYQRFRKRLNLRIPQNAEEFKRKINRTTVSKSNQNSQRGGQKNQQRMEFDKIRKKNEKHYLAMHQAQSVEHQNKKDFDSQLDKKQSTHKFQIVDSIESTTNELLISTRQEQPSIKINKKYLNLSKMDNIVYQDQAMNQQEIFNELFSISDVNFSSKYPSKLDRSKMLSQQERRPKNGLYNEDNKGQFKNINFVNNLKKLHLDIDDQEIKFQNKVDTLKLQQQNLEKNKFKDAKRQNPILINENQSSDIALSQTKFFNVQEQNIGNQKIQIIKMKQEIYLKNLKAVIDLITQNQSSQQDSQLKYLLQRILDGIKESKQQLILKIDQLQVEMTNLQIKSDSEIEKLTEQFKEFRRNNNIDEYFFKHLNDQTRKDTVRLVKELEKEESWFVTLEEYKNYLNQLQYSDVLINLQSFHNELISMQKGQLQVYQEQNQEVEDNLSKNMNKPPLPSNMFREEMDKTLEQKFNLSIYKTGKKVADRFIKKYVKQMKDNSCQTLSIEQLTLNQEQEIFELQTKLQLTQDELEIAIKNKNIEFNRRKEYLSQYKLMEKENDRIVQENDRLQRDMKEIKYELAQSHKEASEQKNINDKDKSTVYNSLQKLHEAEKYVKEQRKEAQDKNKQIQQLRDDLNRFIQSKAAQQEKSEIQKKIIKQLKSKMDQIKEKLQTQGMQDILNHNEFENIDVELKSVQSEEAQIQEIQDIPDDILQSSNKSNTQLQPISDNEKTVDYKERFQSNECSLSKEQLLKIEQYKKDTTSQNSKSKSLSVRKQMASDNVSDKQSESKQEYAQKDSTGRSKSKFVKSDKQSNKKNEKKISPIKQLESTPLRLPIYENNDDEQESEEQLEESNISKQKSQNQKARNDKTSMNQDLTLSGSSSPKRIMNSKLQKSDIPRIKKKQTFPEVAHQNTQQIQRNENQSLMNSSREEGIDAENFRSIMKPQFKEEQSLNFTINDNMNDNQISNSQGSKQQDIQVGGGKIQIQQPNVMSQKITVIEKEFPKQNKHNLKENFSQTDPRAYINFACSLFQIYLEQYVKEEISKDEQIKYQQLLKQTQIVINLIKNKAATSAGPIVNGPNGKSQAVTIQSPRSPIYTNEEISWHFDVSNQKQKLSQEVSPSQLNKKQQMSFLKKQSVLSQEKSLKQKKQVHVIDEFEKRQQESIIQGKIDQDIDQYLISSDTKQEYKINEALSETTNEVNMTSKLSSLKDNQALLSSIAFRAAHRYSMGGTNKAGQNIQSDLDLVQESQENTNNQDLNQQSQSPKHANFQIQQLQKRAAQTAAIKNRPFQK